VAPAWGSSLTVAGAAPALSELAPASLFTSHEGGPSRATLAAGLARVNRCSPRDQLGLTRRELLGQVTPQKEPDADRIRASVAAARHCATRIRTCNDGKAKLPGSLGCIEDLGMIVYPADPRRSHGAGRAAGDAANCSRNRLQPMSTPVTLKMRPHPPSTTIRARRSVGRIFKTGISIVCTAL
jgi:hypothetical protein